MLLTTFLYKSYKIFYRAGTEDEKVLEHSFENDIFYREIPELSFSENPTVIDIGAHIGTFSILTAIKSNARVFAIEASLESFNILNQNILSNDLRNVFPIHAAMGAIDGRVKLYHDMESGNWGHSITTKLSDSYENVSAFTLETFLNRNAITEVDLIKFNCEGAEMDILMTAPEHVLGKIHSAIILYHCDLNNRYSLLQLTRKLKAVGFITKQVFHNENRGRGWLILYNRKKYSRLSLFLKKILKKLA